MTTPSTESTPTATERVPGTGHTEQTFLIGEHVYLRPIAAADAKAATAWRDTIFPVSTERTEDYIKETIDKQDPFKEITLALVRKADDVVVGSIHANFAWIAADFSGHVDPLYGEQGQAWKAEGIVLVAQWVVNEQHAISGLCQLPASETVVIAGLAQAGFREVARFREWFIRDGKRVDKVALEYLNASWVATLGDPATDELPRAGTGEARPVPEKVTLESDPPENAILVGKRVYLRPPTREDVEEVVKYSRRETETFFDIGRHMPDIEGFADWNETSQKEEFPRWVRFSACLRETGEVIGEVGLFDVDLINRTAESASFFHRPEYRGGGYGSEAKQLMMEYAFDRLGLHVIQSWVYFPNTRSAAALRKQGYTEAGRIHWRFINEGTWENFIVFDFLASEWRAMPRKDWDQAAG
ncbi:MAG TPA: GNAT family protein [Thermomicrobiales bacterium]|nr:GNAT family protein [Thermomicrobiales bacterium]